MSTFSPRLFMKNTTKLTLNDRFTAYRQQAQSQVRQKIQTQRQASAESRRLAQQMANRPSVIAALRLKKRSLQQRLGRMPGQGPANIKSRLNLSGRANTNSLRNRLGNVRGRGGLRRGFRPGTSPLIKARLGAPSGSGFGSPFRQPQRFGRQNRRGNFNRQSRGGFSSVLRRNAPNTRGTRGRGGRGVRGAGGAPRWNKSGVPALPTRQELDNQLDEYMAETKSSLDAELNHYMKTEGF